MNNCIIIVFPGEVAGGIEIRRLNVEKTRLPIIIPGIITKRLMDSATEKKIAPIVNGMKEKSIPYKDELQRSPRRIVFIEIGLVINLSRVLRIVSHGRTIGPIDVDVRKISIAINPEIRKRGGIFLPTVKEKKRMIGKKIP